VFCNASGVKVSFFTEFKWPVKNLTHLDHWNMDFLSFVSAPDKLKLPGLSRKRVFLLKKLEGFASGPFDS